MIFTSCSSHSLIRALLFSRFHYFYCFQMNETHTFFFVFLRLFFSIFFLLLFRLHLIIWYIIPFQMDVDVDATHWHFIVTCHWCDSSNSTIHLCAMMMMIRPSLSPRLSSPASKKKESEKEKIDENINFMMNKSYPSIEIEYIWFSKWFHPLNDAFNCPNAVVIAAFAMLVQINCKLFNRIRCAWVGTPQPNHKCERKEKKILIQNDAYDTDMSVFMSPNAFILRNEIIWINYSAIH